MMLIFCPVKTLITMRSTTIFVYSFFLFFLKKMKTFIIVLLITNNSNISKNNSNNNTKTIPLPTTIDRHSYT